MKETKPRFFCFTLMPFTSEFDDVYSLGIKAACDSVGAYCERVDEQIFQESILERIYNQISKADLIIADMSTKNPNVFYEVGYAHALGKSTILLTQDSNDIPFDMKHFQHIVYNKKISYLKSELAKRVKWHLNNPTINKSISEVKFDIFLGEYNLLKEKVTFVVSKAKVPLVSFVLYNPSVNTFNPGSFRIGIISPAKFNRCQDQRVDSIKLPDGNYMHMLPHFDTIYPESYAKFIFFLAKSPEPDHKEEFILRVFSSMEKTDYPFYIRKNTQDISFIEIN